MENIDVPIFIPKVERVWYRDAVIGANAGKPLAALFYLRIFIEQFARRMTGLHGKHTGDEIFSAYLDTLPSEHQNSMPSLKEWYEKLSAAIHNAQDDPNLYEEAIAQVNHHFDIRRVFNISEVPMAAAASQQPVDDSAEA